MKNRIKTIFVLLAMVVVSNGFAQDLTKEETVNYINKKLKEAVDYKFSDGEEGYILAQSFKLEEDFIILTDNRGNSTGDCYNTKDYTKDYKKVNRESRLKANYIKEINEITSLSNPTMGRIDITFHPKLVKYKASNTIGIHTFYWKKVYTGVIHYGEKIYDEVSAYKTNCNTFNETGTLESHSLYFVKEDKNSGSKLIKALTYLIDLYQAEDDPFGN